MKMRSGFSERERGGFAGNKKKQRQSGDDDDDDNDCNNCSCDGREEETRGERSRMRMKDARRKSGKSMSAVDSFAEPAS